MQNIVIDGNLGADPETRYTQAGKQMTTLNVAVSDGSKDRESGEFVERTNWYRVHVPERQAEYVQRRAQKGTQVFASGRLNVGTYQSKDGETRYSFDIWASDVTLGARQIQSDTDGATEGSNTSTRTSKTSNGASTPAKSASAGTRSAAKEEDPDLSDLPFNLPRHIQEPWLNWRAP